RFREARGEVEAADGLPLARAGAGDEDHLGRRCGEREEDGGAEAPERLGGGRVRLVQYDEVGVATAGGPGRRQRAARHAPAREREVRDRRERRQLEEPLDLLAALDA